MVWWKLWYSLPANKPTAEKRRLKTSILELKPRMGIVVLQVTPHSVTTESDRMQFILEDEQRNIQRNCTGENNFYPVVVVAAKGNCVVELVMDFVDSFVE